jgi:hypothetical protein
MEEPLQFKENELETMSRKDLQTHAKTHGLKANAKNSVLIDQLREICQSRNQKAGGSTEADVPKETAKVEEMEVETKKPAKRGTKRVAATPLVEEPKPKEAKVEEREISPVREKSPVPTNSQPYKDFMSPKVIREKLAHSARSFLTPVKDTPSKVMITPRSHKPQGKILPKSPFLFNITDEKKVPETPNKQNQQERSKIQDKLASLQENVMPVSALDIYTVGVQTAPRLISAGAIQFLSNVLRRFIINICSYALCETENGKESLFQSLTNATSEVFEEGEIHSQAIRESLSARDRYIQYKDEDMAMNAKAGLTINVENMSKLLAQIGVNAEFVFVLGLTAICEYIIAEVFEVCPTVNVETDLIITRDVLISSLKTDKELNDLLNTYVQQEIEVYQSDNKKQLEVANTLVESLKKNDNWSQVAATQKEITELVSVLKSTLPIQLKTFFLAQNGNETFGVDNIATIISEHGSCASGDLLNILEFIPLKNRENNEYDCYDSLSGCIIRLSLPSDDPSSSPVLATSLSDYIQKCSRGSLSVPKIVSSTLGSVNIIASQVCDLFNSAKNAEETNLHNALYI